MDKDIRFFESSILVIFFLTREHSGEVGCLPSFLPLVRQHLFLVYRSYGDLFFVS
jgi:hypothetical protein